MFNFIKISKKVDDWIFFCLGLGLLYFFDISLPLVIVSVLAPVYTFMACLLLIIICCISVYGFTLIFRIFNAQHVSKIYVPAPFYLFKEAYCSNPSKCFRKYCQDTTDAPNLFELIIVWLLCLTFLCYGTLVIIQSFDEIIQFIQLHWEITKIILTWFLIYISYFAKIIFYEIIKKNNKKQNVCLDMLVQTFVMSVYRSAMLLLFGVILFLFKSAYTNEITLLLYIIVIFPLELKKAKKEQNNQNIEVAPKQNILTLKKTDIVNVIMPTGKTFQIEPNQYGQYLNTEATIIVLHADKTKNQFSIEEFGEILERDKRFNQPIRTLNKKEVSFLFDNQQEGNIPQVPLIDEQMMDERIKTGWLDTDYASVYLGVPNGYLNRKRKVDYILKTEDVLPYIETESGFLYAVEALNAYKEENWKTLEQIRLKAHYKR